MHYMFYMLRIHPVINTVSLLAGVLIWCFVRKRRKRIKDMLYIRNRLCSHCGDLLSRVLNDAHLQKDPYHRENGLNRIVYLVYLVNIEASLIYDVKAIDYMRSATNLIEDLNDRIFRKKYAYDGGDYFWLGEMRGYLSKYKCVKRTEYS